MEMGSTWDIYLIAHLFFFFFCMMLIETNKKHILPKVLVTAPNTSHSFQDCRKKVNRERGEGGETHFNSRKETEADSHVFAVVNQAKLTHLKPFCSH